MENNNECLCTENPHSYICVQRSWQTVESLGTLIVLQHAEEILVCSKCGMVIDPWINRKEEKS